MFKSKFCLLIFSLFFLVISSVAEDKEFYHNNLNYCKPTKSYINDYEPMNFESSNNLLKKTGEEELYCGEKIIIKGRVLDKDCIPVPDAVIYAWQVNCSGKYPYNPLKNRINKDITGEENNGMTFTGNGTAITNSNGEFFFITVYPQSVHNLASHINIRIKHDMLGILQTRLMLKGHKIKRPKSDPELGEIEKMAAKEGTSIYNFDIVLSREGIKEY